MGGQMDRFIGGGVEGAGCCVFPCLSLPERERRRDREQGFLERLRFPETPARRPPRAVNQSNVGTSPAHALPPASQLLPAPAPSPPALGPARYNYSPLIRPGPGKRLPRGGQAFGFRHRQPLPTALPAELLGHQPGLSPLAG